MHSIVFPGSRWWKFDFHTHTPTGSADYRGDKTIGPKEWLEHHKNRDIHCVVVTDHNGGEWIDQLKKTLATLKQGDASWRNFFVLPGVELSCSSGVHVLAVLAEDCTSQDVAALVGKCGYQGTLGDSDAVTSTSAVEVMKIIQGSPWYGLAIPAHVDCEKGLFKSIQDVATLRDALKLANALQVIDLNTLTALVKDETCQQLLAKLAKVQGSDSHNAAAVPSDKFSWLKMTEPSLEGLKLALAEPELSVQCSHEPPEHEPKQWIESLEIFGLNKRRKNLKIEFNPWLNAVIGGRGSGKSSVVECLRWVLDRGDEVDHQLGKDHEVSKSVAAFGDAMVLDKTCLKATVRGAGKLVGRYRYEWEKNADKQSVMRPGVIGCEEWIKTEIRHADVITDFPVRLFSQKQIHALANQPGGLLSYIDSSRTEDLYLHIWQLQRDFGEDPRSSQEATWLANAGRGLTVSMVRTSAINRFESARERVRTLQSELDAWPQVKDQLAQVNESLEAYATQGIHNKFQTLQRVRSEKRVMHDFQDGINSDVNALIDAIASVKFNNWQINLSNDCSSEASALAGVWQKSLQTIRTSWQNIDSQVLALRAQVNDLKSEVAYESWNAKVSTEEDVCLLALETVKTQLGGQLQQVGVLQQTKEELEQKNAAFFAKSEEMNAAKQLVSQRYEEMVEARIAITKVRQAFVDRLNKNAPEETLKITLHSAAQYDQKCVDALRHLLGLNSAEYANVFMGDLENVESKGIVATLNRRPDLLGDFKKTVEELVVRDGASIQTVLEADLGGERSYIRSALKSISPQKLDELWAWFPEDKVQVQFRQSRADKWQDISEGSAGQKTGAMLSFILNEGDEPLILDQPEDDLDNENVSKLVVAQLRQSKSRRQVIVVTHNANIVVNGDAELVIPMAFRGGQIQMDSVGGLQDASIRTKICEVMEGGEKAFRNRYQRVLEPLKS